MNEQSASSLAMWWWRAADWAGWLRVLHSQLIIFKSIKYVSQCIALFLLRVRVVDLRSVKSLDSLWQSIAPSPAAAAAGEKPQLGVKIDTVFGRDKLLLWSYWPLLSLTSVAASTAQFPRAGFFPVESNARAWCVMTSLLLALAAKTIKQRQ
jgi:hypothetical protein